MAISLKSFTSIPIHTAFSFSNARALFSPSDTELLVLNQKNWFLVNIVSKQIDKLPFPKLDIPNYVSKTSILTIKPKTVNEKSPTSLQDQIGKETKETESETENNQSALTISLSNPNLNVESENFDDFEVISENDFPSMEELQKNGMKKKILEKNIENEIENKERVSANCEKDVDEFNFLNDANDSIWENYVCGCWHQKSRFFFVISDFSQKKKTLLTELKIETSFAFCKLKNN